MATIRIWHTYLGLLIAPSVLFFSVTGALQLFGLHEAHGGYKPAPVIEKLGTLHKVQVLAPADRHRGPPRVPEVNRQERPSQHDDRLEEFRNGPGRPPLAAQILLKFFFFLVALGLATATSFGIWMGLTHIPHKRVGRWLLLVGVAVPVVFASLSSTV